MGPTFLFLQPAIAIDSRYLPDTSIININPLPHLLNPQFSTGVDESFLFPLPDLDSRKKMLRMFMERHLVAATKTGKSIQIDEEVMTDAYLDDLAVRMDGFSGRQIAKTCLAFQSAVFGSGTNRLSKGLTDAVFEWKLAHIEDDMDTVERKKGEELSKQAGNLGTY